MGTKVSELPADSAPTSTDYVVLLDTETNTLKKVLVSELLADNLLVGPDGIVGIKKNNLTTDSNPYKFHAYRNAAQTPGSGGVVQFDTEFFDTNSNFDITTNKGRYTVPVSGFYQFNANITVTTSAANQDTGLKFKKNGSTIINSVGFVNMYAGATSVASSGSCFIQLTADDYIEVTCSSTLALNVASSVNNQFSGYLVCRT